jgi:hypothetical protein
MGFFVPNGAEEEGTEGKKDGKMKYLIFPWMTLVA